MACPPITALQGIIPENTAWFLTHYKPVGGNLMPARIDGYIHVKSRDILLPMSYNLEGLTRATTGGTRNLVQDPPTGLPGKIPAQPVK